MGLELPYHAGQTPLDATESEGLLLKTISTQGELNEAEQLNVQQAIEWTLRRKFGADRIFSQSFCNELHRRMYGNVWDWAGKFRRTDKNIGVSKYEIAAEMRKLLDDCLYWIGHETYSQDEIAIQFKHRVVSIHCYSNGNGRHSRLMADTIINHVFGKPAFTWGANNLAEAEKTREKYLQALRMADKGVISPLIAFSRS